MPDEPNLGGGFMSGRVRQYGRMFGQGFSGTAQVGLKFDVKGLTEFQTQIKKSRDEIKLLRTSFDQLVQGPKTLYEQLRKVNTELAAMKRNMPQGGGTNPFGVAPNQITLPTGNQTPVRGTQVTGAASGGGGAATAISALSGGAGPMDALVRVLTKLSDVTAQVVQAGVDRVERNRQISLQADVFASRMVGLGRAPAQFGAYAANAQFGGNMQDYFQTMNTLYGQGMYVGGQGTVGARGAAAATSIRMLQALNPGMAPQQAAGLVTGMAQNVAAQRGAQGIFGQAALMFKPGGGMKDLPSYFSGIMTALERRKTRPGPFTKEQIQVARSPGSNMSGYLAMLGMTPEMMDQFYNWAEARASYSGPGEFTGTEEQMRQVRGGRSQAAEAQRTATEAGQKEARMADKEYDAYIKAEENDRKMLELQTKIEKHLDGIYRFLIKLPAPVRSNLPAFLGIGGALGQLGAFGNIASGLLGGGNRGNNGDPGYGLGDAESSTTHLNPDVRNRVERMMAANPSLQIVSAYRDQNRQRRLWQSGNPFVAPPGKSSHARGQAADMGPPSQYGWLAKNARKFGLSTAGHMGEPWHVQLSGTMGFLGDQEASAAALAQQTANVTARQFALWQLVQGQRLAQQSAAQTAAPDALSGTTAESAGTSAGTSAGPAGTTLGEFFTDVLKGLGAPVSQSNLDKLAMVAKGEGGGGSFNPFNYIVGPGTNFNKVGVKNYPDWATGVQYTVRLLGQKNTSAMLSSLMSDSSYSAWQKAVAGFYGSWGGALPNVSQKSADAWLAHVPKWAPVTSSKTGQVNGTGDVGYTPPNGGGGLTTVSSSPVVFNNTFVIQGGGSGGSDMDRIARGVASRLEPLLDKAVKRRT